MSIPPPPAVNPSDVTSSGKTVSQFYCKSDVLKPEVLWTSSKYYGCCSYNSNEKIDKINRAVSEQPSSCKVYPRFKEDILSCVLGTAEQFKEVPTKFLNGYFTILFYESLNKNSQAKQMDNFRVSKETVAQPRWEIET